MKRMELVVHDPNPAPNITVREFIKVVIAKTVHRLSAKRLMFSKETHCTYFCIGIWNLDKSQVEFIDFSSSNSSTTGPGGKKDEFAILHLKTSILRSDGRNVSWLCTGATGLEPSTQNLTLTGFQYFYEKDGVSSPKITAPINIHSLTTVQVEIESGTIPLNNMSYVQPEDRIGRLGGTVPYICKKLRVVHLQSK
jgi:hypothetical protein